MAKRMIRDIDSDYYEAIPAARSGAYTSPPVVTTGDRLARLVYVVTTILETLLAFRLLLRLFAANSGNAFVSFIYGLTAPLVQPFFGIFNLTIDDSVPGFEVATIVAMVVYGVIGYLLAALIRAIRGRAL